MRKFSLAIVAALLFVSSNLIASTTDSNQPESLSTQIQKILDKSSYEVKNNDVFAQVRFTLNKEGEIVVLSVDTEDIDFEGFVKGRLNYKKVDVGEVNEGKMYTVSVRVTA